MIPDLFAGILGKIAELSWKNYGDSADVTKAFRIVGDHMRTSTFILGDDRGLNKI